jgi:hypothetical protein
VELDSRKHLIGVCDVPSPGLLRLEENGDSRIVKSGEEDKVDNVADIFFDLDGEVENETW